MVLMFQGWMKQTVENKEKQLIQRRVQIQIRQVYEWIMKSQQQVRKRTLNTITKSEFKWKKKDWHPKQQLEYNVLTTVYDFNYVKNQAQKKTKKYTNMLTCIQMSYRKDHFSFFLLLYCFSLATNLTNQASHQKKKKAERKLWIQKVLKKKNQTL